MISATYPQVNMGLRKVQIPKEGIRHIQGMVKGSNFHEIGSSGGYEMDEHEEVAKLKIQKEIR